MKMIVRDGKRKDIDQVFDLARMFFAESVFSKFAGLDEKGWRRIYKRACWGRGYGVFVVEVEGRIVAYAVMQICREFLDRSFADVYQIYIHPDFRGTGASRGLSECIDRAFAACNVGFGFVSCASGFEGTKNNGLFSNLWKRLGYVSLGTEMIKIYNPKE